MILYNISWSRKKSYWERFIENLFSVLIWLVSMSILPSNLRTKPLCCIVPCLRVWLAVKAKIWKAKPDNNGCSSAQNDPLPRNHNWNGTLFGWDPNHQRRSKKIHFDGTVSKWSLHHPKLESKKQNLRQWSHDKYYLSPVVQKHLVNWNARVDPWTEVMLSYQLPVKVLTIYRSLRKWVTIFASMSSYRRKANKMLSVFVNSFEPTMRSLKMRMKPSPVTFPQWPTTREKFNLPG